MADNETDMMTVKVISMGENSGTRNYEIAKDADLLGLKVLIFSVTNVQPDLQRLIFMGRELKEDEKSLQELQIKNDVTLHMVVRKPPVQQPPSHQAIPINPVQAIPPQYGNNQNPYAYNQFGYQQQPNQPHDMPPVPGPQLRGMTNSARLVIELSKFVQIFALLDTMFVAFLAFFRLYWLMIGIVATISGYLGARHLKRPYIALYGFFILVYIGVRIYLITIYTDSLSIVIGIMILIIEPYIFRLVWMLFSKIPQLTDEERRTVLTYNMQSSLFSR